MPGYEGIRAGVRGYYSRGTRILEPGYEGITAGVRGYYSRGTYGRLVAQGCEDSQGGGKSVIVSNNLGSLLYCRRAVVTNLRIRGGFMDAEGQGGKSRVLGLH